MKLQIILINGLMAFKSDFAGLRNIIITDQIKKRLPHEVRDHLHDWSKFVSPIKLSYKFDVYGSARNASKKPYGNPSKGRINEKWQPHSPLLERTSKRKLFCTQNTSKIYSFCKLQNDKFIKDDIK